MVSEPAGSHRPFIRRTLLLFSFTQPTTAPVLPRTFHTARTLSQTATTSGEKKKERASLTSAGPSARVASPAAAGRGHLRHHLPLPHACSSPSVPEPRHAAARRRRPSPPPSSPRAPRPRCRIRRSPPPAALLSIAASLFPAHARRPLCRGCSSLLLCAPPRLHILASPSDRAALLLTEAACARLTMEAELGPRPCGIGAADYNGRSGAHLPLYQFLGYLQY